jgi:transketolase
MSKTKKNSENINFKHKKINIDDLKSKYDFSKIIPLKKVELKKIKELKNTNKKIYNLFTLVDLKHEVGEKYLITKILKDKKNPKKKIYDFKNSIIVECVLVKNNHNYYDLKQEDFKNSLYSSISHLQDEIMSKFKNPEVLNLGINFYKFKLLHDLYELENKTDDEINKRILEISKEISIVKPKKKVCDFSINDKIGSTREGFGKGLMTLGKTNKEVVVLCADLSESLKVKEFSMKYPKRFFQMGIAEQNMASCGAGMCLNGKIPFICSFACFNPGRNWDQIRISIAYSKNPVIIVGGHAGLMTGEDGATHQMLEDIALMKVLPEMTVVVPADMLEAKKATIKLAKLKKPSYLRLGRTKTKIITKENEKFEIGKAKIIYESGYDILIIGCGIGVQIAIDSIPMLIKLKVNCTIINLHTIKPLDCETILKYAKLCNKIITIEDHQITGGMGSSIAEFLSKVYPTIIEMIGVDDSFGESGKGEELLKKFNISTDEIIKRTKKLMKL